MNDLIQSPFVTTEFAENPEMRCPCVLVADTSESMKDNDAIGELNVGLVAFKDELEKDAMAKKRVDVAVVSFGGRVEVVQEFTGVETFYPPKLKASGDTPAGEALMLTMQLIRERKTLYRANAIPYYRPWIVFLTDGRPTDQWHAAAAAVREGEAAKAFSFFACGVRGADMATLSQIAPEARPPVRLLETRFTEMFRWLSSSLSAVSHSKGPDDKVALPAPVGWTSVG
ncbi:uncharacterized protein YegL [Bradyrhizobium sp. USDA 4341]